MTRIIWLRPSPFGRYAHEAVGRIVGLADHEMEAACDGEARSFGAPDEIAALRMANAILAGDVSDETWRECVPPLSLDSVFELIVLVGYYSMLAVQMRVLRTEIVPEV
jgi:4-carboxymuconolactone decarboxylase